MTTNVDEQKRCDGYLAVLRKEFIVDVSLVPDQIWQECKRCKSFWSNTGNSTEWHEDDCVFWDGIHQVS